jgi:hypothetical protein
MLWKNNKTPCLYNQGTIMIKGDRVTVIEKPLPQGLDHLEIDVETGEKATINYVDGCCLCVTTDRGTEYTANAQKFNPVK